MLLKWLFTLLAIVWLYQALRPMFLVQRPPASRPPAPPPPEQETRIVKKSRFDNEGDYIDYEEIK